MHTLLSNSQAGSGRTVKQEQEEISRNHVQTFSRGSVSLYEAIEKAMEVFELGGKRPQNLEKLFLALSTIPPT